MTSAASSGLREDPQSAVGVAPDAVAEGSAQGRGEAPSWRHREETSDDDDRSSPPNPYCSQGGAPHPRRRRPADRRAAAHGCRARVLLVPFDDEDWDAVLTSMANHQGRSDAGWLIAMAASGLLAVTAVILAHRLGVTGRTRAAMFATVTTAIGWASCAAICLGGLYLSVAATVPDRAVQVQLQKDFNSGASTGFVFLMALLGVIGYLVLAFGLARGRHHERCGRAHRNRRSGHDHHHGRTVDAAARPHRASLGRRSRPDDSLRGCVKEGVGGSNPSAPTKSGGHSRVPNRRVLVAWTANGMVVMLRWSRCRKSRHRVRGFEAHSKLG